MTCDAAKALRRDSTKAEQRLWAMVRNRGVGGFKFRRQHPIGRFVADFCCWEARLIVEVDGGQHADSAGDDRRTAWLAEQGWRVVRFWNNEVLDNPEGVFDRLTAALTRASS
jgi:very-short-patch-repair endonuclease